MIRTSTLTAILLLAAPAAALAHTNDERLTEQAAMIEAGRSSGSITWREGLALRREQAGIARKNEELARDGYLSRADKRLLHAMQDEAEEHITAEAADGWRRLVWAPRVGR